MYRNVLIGLTVVFLLLAVVTAARAGNRGKVLTEAEVKKISDAMPTDAPAAPAKARRVLVYSKCGGFYHGSIPYGNKAFEVMGDKTGAFEAVVSDDLSLLMPDRIKTFDAIVFNNSTGEMFKPSLPKKPNQKRIKDEAKYKAALAQWEKDVAKAKASPDSSEAVRKSFLDWLSNGGAVIGSHAATDTKGWDEFCKIMGGQFSGHPWNMLVPVKNDDPANPINAAFGGKGFEVADEIYQFNKGFYSRENARVLLSLDMSKLTKPGGRKDNDYAVSWIKTYGKGRIFYCSLGHRPEIYANPAVLKHYVAGIQWAMGDLKGVETKPNPLK